MKTGPAAAGAAVFGTLSMADSMKTLIARMLYEAA
jgi:hypothetical protein